MKSVPTVYLLDNEGKIVAANMECRGEALGKKLEELSTKVMACIKEFNELNGRETEPQGNAQAPSEGAKD